jgi:Zn finger protein HypA/HybF involved in hydrogenase expression
MRCMCGTILEIPSEADGRRQSCPTCRRRFDVRFTEDLNNGQRGVSLLYVTGDKASGETSTVGGGTTSFQLSVGDPKAVSNPAGLLIEPEPPDEAHFKCSCGILLSISKKQYEKRSRCPACAARMLVFLLYDASARTFTLQTFSLIDKNTGTTQVLSKL